MFYATEKAFTPAVLVKQHDFGDNKTDFEKIIYLFLEGPHKKLDFCTQFSQFALKAYSTIFT